MSSHSSLSGFAARLRQFMAEAIRVQSAAPPLDEPFNALALELHALQVEHNEPYRRVCESRGAGPGRMSHWSAIPAMPAAAFKELELTCLAPDRRTTVFHSSGTTSEERSRHFHSLESLALYEDSLWAWCRRHLFSEPQNPFPGVKERPAFAGDVLSLTPSVTEAPRSSLAHMFTAVSRLSGAGFVTCAGRVDRAGAWEVDVAPAERALAAAMAHGRPVVLLGTAFGFVHLLDELQARGVRHRLPSGSRVLETGGYKGRSRSLPKDALHAWIGDRLGLPRSAIVCEYGMSELSSQAYDAVAGDVDQRPGDGRVFKFPPWARVRILSPEHGGEVAEGQPGVIRVWDLANVWSVLAVQTGDLGVRRGTGFEWVGRAAEAEPRGCSLMATAVSGPRAHEWVVSSGGLG